MYPCTKCERTYRTQNSLTRHQHSHQKTCKHRCSTCGVVFHRRDLLSRHSKLHQPSSLNDTVEPPSAQTGSAITASGRQRCHTACLRCRELRTKCDGQRPCYTCRNTDSSCQYSSRSNRLSQVLPHVATPAADAPPHESNQHGGQPDNVGCLLYEGSCLPTQSVEHPRENDPHPGIHHVGQSSPDRQSIYDTYNDCSLAGISIRPEHSTSSVATGETSDAGTMSWPWLHENLFLPADSHSFANMMSSVQFPYSQDETLAELDLESFSNLSSLPTQSHASQPEVEILLGQASTSDGSSSTAHDQASTNIFATGTLADTCSLDQGVSITSRENQNLVIENLVGLASSPTWSNQSDKDHANSWALASTKVALAFGLTDYQECSGSSALYDFCAKYVEHFGPLWPLFSLQTLDLDSLHPILFLVLTSIGSMYCGSNASNYGAMMHATIRSTLTMVWELENEELGLLWLAQARLLTQVAALYFGQPKAFTYAHHLGALLVAQARRMDLFSAAYFNKAMQRLQHMKDIASDEERLEMWLQLETRRRLAFGIFRGDSYTSVLLHSKPLISMEEIDLQLPMCDAIWRSKKMSASLCLQMIELDQTPSRELWASDIYRIAMDKNEPLPPLDPAGQELLMFGLQYSIWRFSKDQNMFARLSGDLGGFDSDDLSSVSSDSPSEPILGRNPGSERPSTRRLSNSATKSSETHCLDSTVRRMEDLRQQHRRLLSALEKWEQGLPLVKTFVRTNLDRSCLMSGLILFHLGHLRLHVPLEDLHQIQYRLADNLTVEDRLVSKARKWANSRQGRIAAERACSIWKIIDRESKLEKEKRVNFNLLAFIGLHHSAVAVWAYTGTRNDKVNRNFVESSNVLEGLEETTAIDPQGIGILSSFVDLYGRISPAGWSSFAKAAATLSKQHFPDTKGY
ncbi:hypothetical protein BKA58DRAFT_77969 [Alternaria rosae]|uniref:uncharacterized protein n=1 Tax=Alternaria rosae TaxID=1187941 RepID=UPI001E8EF091|nr:uncharacterized protein BKA58DRAFT_77969 [Alternaria rosae]KAH6877588.1 hypothetical protein BKA58DRAFT_77969 [Alternaria rosae]